MYQLADALFPSRARRAVLLGLFGPRGNAATVSELARQAGLTPRAVAVEVRRLAGTGLVEVEAKGAADLVHPCRRHPAARALSRLMKQAASASGVPLRDPRPSLAAYGAPLAGPDPVPAMSREEALVVGLLEARTDPTLLRVLPVMVLRNEGQFDWDDVRSRARRAKLKAELGMLLDLTAAVSGHAGLHEHTRGLADHRRRVPRDVPEPASVFERRLADKRTPPVARRWGFRMNMSEASVREFVKKHAA